MKIATEVNGDDLAPNGAGIRSCSAIAVCIDPLIAWLFVLFISFGLFAPRNPLVVVALLVCAISILGADTLIVDMDSPFEGIILVSAQPMQEALAKMSAP